MARIAEFFGLLRFLWRHRGGRKCSPTCDASCGDVL
jgi:hypothetical protein